MNTITELIAVLGKNIEDLQGVDSMYSGDRDIVLSRCHATAATAKQIINAINLVQKEDKLTNRHEATDHFIGYYEDESR